MSILVARLSGTFEKGTTSSLDQVTGLLSAKRPGLNDLTFCLATWIRKRSNLIPFADLHCETQGKEHFALRTTYRWESAEWLIAMGVC